MNNQDKKGLIAAGASGDALVFDLITNKEDKLKLKNAVSEISNSLTRIEGERDNIKEIILKIEEDLQIDKKVIRQLGTIYHKQNFVDRQQESEEVATLYETITA